MLNNKEKKKSMDVIAKWANDIHTREKTIPKHQTFTGGGNTTEDNKNKEDWESNLSMEEEYQEQHINRANVANLKGDSNAFKRLPSSMWKQKTIQDKTVKKARRWYFRTRPSTTPGGDYDPHDEMRYILPR